jgi:hypothetical protein
MSKMTPKKAEKKKAREKESRKKVLARRDAIRSSKSAENKIRKKMKRIVKLQKDVENLGPLADDVLLNMSDKTLSQLERNAQILKALENEYEEERSKKDQLNSELESKGALSLSDKLSFLHNELAEKQRVVLEGTPRPVKTGDARFGSSAPGEVAEVTVLKAPVLEEKPEEA